MLLLTWSEFHERKLSARKNATIGDTRHVTHMLCWSKLQYTRQRPRMLPISNLFVRRLGAPRKSGVSRPVCKAV